MTQITLSVLFRGAPHTALPCLEAATQPALDKSFQVTTLGGGGEWRHSPCPADLLSITQISSRGL